LTIKFLPFPIEETTMHILLAFGVTAAIAAAGTTLTAVGSAQGPKRMTKLSDYMQCYGLRTVGNDINAQASQGWTVTSMVDHTSPDGQECLLVLFQRENP
jgi:hypothetical protein